MRDTINELCTKFYLILVFSSLNDFALCAFLFLGETKRKSRNMSMQRVTTILQACEPVRNYLKMNIRSVQRVSREIFCSSLEIKHMCCCVHVSLYDIENTRNCCACIGPK